MVEISNIKVYDLEESVIACRNAMRLTPAAPTAKEFSESLKRAKILASSPSNSGHANFLKGIRVSFDIKYPNYFSPELQRYAFCDIVTSSSKMHKILKMATMPEAYNKYVNQASLDNMKHLVQSYNIACETGSVEDQYEAFMMVVSNCPQGIELFMRCSTNYMQLRNIYNQRHNHKLKEDWGAFCHFIEGLPYACDFITYDVDKKNSEGSSN